MKEREIGGCQQGRVRRLLLVSFSGGETSAYMAKMLIDNYSDVFDLFFVYANTGKEREETLEFIDKCDKSFNMKLVWVEAVTNPEYGKGVNAKIVDFKTASRNGEPFKQMIAKHGIPNVENGFCTRELKDYTIRSYCRSIGLKNNDYQIAIGIRSDEIDRVNPNRKKLNLFYPLVELRRTTKPEINSFWSDMPFRLELKSYEGNCDFCFKKSDRKLLTIAKENPNILKWWADIENEFSMYNPRNANPPFRFFRKNRETKWFLDNSVDFIKLSTDEKLTIVYQAALFTELDYSGSCEESCLPFNNA